MRRFAVSSIVFLSLVALVVMTILVTPSPDGARGTRTTRLIDSNKAVGVGLYREGSSFVLNLVKGARGWDAVIDGTFFRVKPGKAERFIDALEKSRKITPTGSMPQAFAEGSTILTLASRSGAELARLQFGTTDAAGKDIYFRTMGTEGVFRTVDDISEFLDTTASAWIELAIYRERLRESEIQEVTYEGNGVSRSFRAGRDVEVASLESFLLGLTCSDVTNVALPAQETIKITYGDTRTDDIFLARYDTVWVLTDGSSGCGYIVTERMKNEIDRALGLASLR